VDYIETFRYLIMAFWGILTGLFIMGAVWLVYSKETSHISDGNLGNWRGRRREIFHLASRIRTGQSSAIIGLFSEEKTEILRYLNNQEPQQRQMLYRDKADALIFSYIDMAMDLSEHDTPAKFWELALSGISRTVRADSDIAQAYRFCVDAQFQKPEVEDFLSALVREGKRLVLLLDRFERLLDYSEFKNNWEFFTTLRRFSTSQEPPLLTLVIASNLSLPRLHEEIQQNQKTSPVLNFIEVTPIMGLPEQDVDQLLREEVPQLSEEQRNFVKDMTGGHPYFLQKVLNQKVLDKEVDLSFENETLVEQLKNIFCDKVLEDDIRFAPAYIYQALLAIVAGKEVANFESALKELEEQGIIVKKSDKWQIRARIFEKCLASIDIELQST